MRNITDLAGLACARTARNRAMGKQLHEFVQIRGWEKERNMGQQGCCPIIRNYRMAIGLPGEPVAPLRRSGAKLKANS